MYVSPFSGWLHQWWWVTWQRRSHERSSLRMMGGFPCPGPRWAGACDSRCAKPPWSSGDLYSPHGVNDTDWWTHTAIGWCHWYRLVTAYTHCLVSKIQTWDSIHALVGVADTDLWQQTHVVWCQWYRSMTAYTHCLASMIRTCTAYSHVTVYTRSVVSWIQTCDSRQPLVGINECTFTESFLNNQMFAISYGGIHDHGPCWAGA